MEGLLEAVNKNDNSHYVEVSTGTIASDVIRQSAIVGGSSSGGGGAGGDNFAEFGGIDPNLDPELAMAFRVSMEEARQQANTGGNGSDSNNTASDNSNNNNGSSTTTMDVQGGEDEDALLQQALQMSMAQAMGETNTTMDVVNDDDQGEDDDEAAQLAAALAMSTNNNDTTEVGDTQGNDDTQFSDPSFVNQLLSDLPGVDMNDPQIQAAMAALGAGSKNDDKDGNDKKKDSDK